MAQPGLAICGREESSWVESQLVDVPQEPGSSELAMLSTLAARDIDSSQLCWMDTESKLVARLGARRCFCWNGDSVTPPSANPTIVENILLRLERKVN